MNCTLKEAQSARWVLVSLAIPLLLASIGISVPNVALPTLVSVFAVSFSQVQWVILTYLLTMTVLIVSVGRLGDLMGRRRVLLAGIFLYSIGALICGVAPGFWLLILGRAIQGLGAATLMALTVASVSETVSAKRAGSAMGLMGTMSAVGTAAGPSLGGLLIAEFGWRSVFFLMSLLGLLSFTLAYRCLPVRSDRAETERSSFDGVGSLMLALTLGTYALAMTVGGGISRLAVALLAMSVVAGGLFIFTESKAASPLIHMAAFRNPVLSANLMMNALVSTVMMSTLVIGPFYLSRALGLDAAMVGLVMSVGPVMSTLSGIPAGRVVDRLGAPSVILIGLAEMALGVISLSVLPSRFGLGGYVFSVALLSPGYQLFQAANNTLMMMNVRSDQRGVVSGMLSLSRNLGLITGASLMGAVFAFAAGTTQIGTALPASVAMGMRITFSVAAVLVGVALSLGFGMRTYAEKRSDSASTFERGGVEANR